MPKREAPLDYLNHYLPVTASKMILELLHQHRVHLTITKTRKSILGDYRHATDKENHRISVNGNLNKYAFLITLIHELAHLVTFKKYGNRVNSHGAEWKGIYKSLLEQFMNVTIFPKDILLALSKSINDLPASSCSDINLTRSLKKYDEAGNTILVEEVREGTQFKTADGRIFRRGKQNRKRIECMELPSGKMYLFSPVYEVEKISQD